MTLYVTYIHRSHPNIKPIHNDYHFDIAYRTLNLLGQAMYLKKRVYDYEPSEHKRCYGNFDNLRLESSDSTLHVCDQRKWSYNATIPSQDLLEKEGVDCRHIGGQSTLPHEDRPGNIQILR
jgi:hypothetical protein